MLFVDEREDNTLVVAKENKVAEQEKKEVVNAQEPVKGKIQDKAGKKNYLMGSLRRMP